MRSQQTRNETNHCVAKKTAMTSDMTTTLLHGSPKRVAADDCSTTSTTYSGSSEELFCAPCNVVTLQHDAASAPASSGDDCKECLICWDDLKAGDGPHDTLPCGHTFHRSCVNDWRYQNQTCPTCRVNLEFAEMHC